MQIPQLIRLACLCAALLLSTTIMSQELYRMPEGARSSVSSFENPNGRRGEGGKSNKTAKGNAFERVAPGATKTLLDIDGTGIVQRMWFTVRDRDVAMLRSMRLRIWWDNSSHPAVDVPFGDFFGANLGRTMAFQSALISSPEGRSYNCIIPMPFRKGAKITLTNESNVQQSMLYYDIDYIMLPSLPDDAQYFHAYWTRQRNNPLKQDFEVLPQLKGKGRYLGMTVGVNADKRYANTWFGEGEVKIYLDGDGHHPTINGTGTEDYIGTGWGLGAFANTYQGCPLADDSAKQYNFYRWHVPDAIYFQKEIRVTLQEIGGGFYDEVLDIWKKGVPLEPVSVDMGPDQPFVRLYEMRHTPKLTDGDFPKGWVNFYRVDDYTAVSYFYYDEPSSNLPALPDVSKRL